MKPQDVHPLVRRIEGTNVATDPVFLGPSVVQRSTNWVPDDFLTLAKRRGTGPFQTIPAGIRIDAMLYTPTPTARYLYAVAIQAGEDALYVSTNDGPFTFVPNGVFATQGGRYGMSLRGDTLYVGNGVSPMKRVPVGGAAVDLGALLSTNDTGQSAVAAADASSGLLPGTYSYCWAVYDSSTGQFVSRGPVRTVTLTGSWSKITFTAPSTGLAAPQGYHLFLASADQQIEGAHDQVVGGLTAGATYVAVSVVPSSRPVPRPSTVTYTGKFLANHRGRVFMAGDPMNPRVVMATGVLIPGLEQLIFEQGDMFPANARLPPIRTPVTGLGVVGPTTATDVPRAFPRL